MFFWICFSSFVLKWALREPDMQPFSPREFLLCSVFLYLSLHAGYVAGKTPLEASCGRFRHQLSMGIPMALQFAITASGTMIMQAAINLFGSEAVAALRRPVSCRIWSHRAFPQWDRRWQPTAGKISERAIFHGLKGSSRCTSDFHHIFDRSRCSRLPSSEAMSFPLLLG